ncbi:LysM peptidoglycan-binding domain-containing protein [Xanthomonas vesicatoria]|uniref:Potassium binding protein Kbp n=1 Tax=Xanthomonas vesicatoria TaxID=56460 RepID=A0AAJ0IUF3_9XANT|nr:LysM peptidoglycan-binding domain-containing protein [Xanthomonas vesicatoria]APO95393.1 peptidoglycan-binding protein LysM [Xanthomonas vesicatoria]KHM90482.1 peptidoglycan-binding protein LysM [Xanthomonas vesicatoria]KHM90714.1 peptidoglycan-binding protein LysM [Xanthomonas vesicatoria]KTF31718.1 peptidoglycan-binding protein LysM [Xanthomonas vesicatoria]MCC8557964.1 LysM peptidoglycan-binding domain-containing protein [Xanthomonas vesicatoria]
MSADKKADFSTVTSSVDSTAEVTPAPDFSKVRTSMQSTAELVEESITVQAGDSLSSIAKRHLGDGGLWPRIFEANRETLKDPDKIFPGQVLRLPHKA